MQGFSLSICPHSTRPLGNPIACCLSRATCPLVNLTIKIVPNPEVQKEVLCFYKFDKFKIDVNSCRHRNEQLGTLKSCGVGRRWWSMWSLWSAGGRVAHSSAPWQLGKKGRARISPEASCCHGRAGQAHQGLGASQGQPQARAVAMQSDRSSSSGSDRAIIHVT